MPWAAASMRPCLSWVRASAEPSVPMNWIGLLPQFFSLHAAICAGNMVRRLAPTFLPQSDAASLNSALRDCCTKNCGPLLR
ncbi:hypothetical protein ACVW0J_002869 [Bradyrhizobium sp. i1.7.7]